MFARSQICVCDTRHSASADEQSAGEGGLTGLTSALRTCASCNVDQSFDKLHPSFLIWPALANNLRIRAQTSGFTGLVLLLSKQTEDRTRPV